MTGITTAMLETLSKPTPPDEVKQRQGPGGKMLDYVDARFVMDRLDEIGPENWQDQYVDRDGGSVRCGIGVHVEGQWIWKWDVGTQSDIEPEKGSYSEAFKRAAVKWGIARDLYGHAPTHGRAAPPSPQRPVSRPPSLPAGGSTPSEPEYLAATFHDAPERPETPVDGGTCPAHGTPWKDGKYGWFCSGKAIEGYRANQRGYCDEKPTPKWKALQEVAS